MPTKKQIQEFAEERDEFVNDFSDEIEEMLEKYEDYLYGLLMSFISERDEPEDLIYDLRKVLSKDEMLPEITQWWKAKTAELIGLTAAYYNLYGVIRKETTEEPLFDFLDEHIKTVGSFKDEISRFTIGLALSGMTIAEISKSLSDKLKKADKQGFVTRKLLSVFRDTAIEVSRATDLRYAREEGFKYAYYLGGLIETSRCFCQQRDQLIWSVDRINKWNDLSWGGKIEGVDVKIALGGYNCRHYLMWIDDETAEKYGYDREYSECY